jgi:PST family polysaccharide transporter
MLQTIAILLAMPVEYGFHLSGVRLIASAKTEAEKISIFATVTIVKFLIYVVVCLVALPIVIFSNAFNNLEVDKLFIYINVVLIVFAVGFRPLWFFQGNSKYRSLIILELFTNILSVLFLLIAIYFDAYFGAILLIIATPKVLGILAMHYKYVKLNYSIDRFDDAKLLIRKSFPLFLHKISAGFLHSAIPYILSFGVSAVALYKYQQAEKTFYVVQSFLLVLSQVGYSNVLKLNSKLSSVNWAEKWMQLNIQLVISTLLAILIFFFAPYVLSLFWGKVDEDVVQILRLFCPLYVLLGLNASLGLVFLLSAGADAAVVRSALVGAFFSILYLILTSKTRSIYDGIISIYLGELTLLIVMIYEIHSMRAHERNI